jgi:hypothetical protein
MRSGFALAILLLSGLAATPVVAQPAAELKLLSEHPVDGMRGGNLSGLALCGKDLWTVSDRDDDQIYRLDTRADTWQAETVTINVPPVPESGLPWGLRARTTAASVIRGGDLDFEGISCDAAGNRYIVSEAHAAVLQVPASGDPEWLKIAPGMVREARASGLLLHFNALFEGLAVNPEGNQIWLAAERERRGLISIKRGQSVWDCDGPCVLLSEAGQEMQPAQFPGARAVSKDFADLALFNGKLFTLERNAFQICRRDSVTAKVELCWSYADEALVPNRRYPQNYGLAEALLIDADGAWIGIDNNFGMLGPMLKNARWSIVLPPRPVAGAPSLECATTGQACRAGVDVRGLGCRTVSGHAVFRAMGGAAGKPQCRGHLTATRGLYRSETGRQRPRAFRRHWPDQRPAGGFHARYRRHRCGGAGRVGRTPGAQARFAGDLEHRQRPQPGLSHPPRPPAVGAISYCSDVRALVAPRGWVASKCCWA